MLGNIHKNQRVAVFVDVQNLYYSAKHLYKGKVNFENILHDAVSDRQLIRAFAYVIKADFEYEKHFFEMLERIGFEVRVKELQIFYGGSKKGDWDVGLAMDMVRMAEKVDVCVLVSGDGDYKELVEYVQAKGCRAEVMAFGRSASIKLKETADMFLDMDLNYKRYIQREQKNVFKDNFLVSRQVSRQLPSLLVTEKNEIIMPPKKEISSVNTEDTNIKEKEEIVTEVREEKPQKKQTHSKKERASAKKAKKMIKSIFKKKR